MKDYYKGKVILVTGAAGSIGKALVQKLLTFKPKTIRALDMNESGLFHLVHEFGTDYIRVLVGDIRDKERLERAVEGVDIIFHAAALKHVSFCELNPFEAIKTNVLGTKNLIETALDEEVEKLITISTDKAVNPINVLGASKLLAERLTVSANLYKGDRKTVFSCVRFGNVLNSNGSVLPIFVRQVKAGGPVTVTDENMTRFVMSIDKAIKLVLKAAFLAKGGEMFILKMPSLKIKDLALAVIEEIAPQYGKKPEFIKIKFTGRREGEKVFEELMNADEASIVNETDDMFVLPIPQTPIPALANGKLYKSDEVDFLKPEQIQTLIREVLGKKNE